MGWAAALVWAFALLATTGFAQPLALPGEPSAADKETARSLVAKGHERLEAGELGSALEAFQGADDIMELPTTGMLVAETQIALGRFLEAREMLLRVERFPKRPDEPAAFSRDRGKAIELGRSIAERIPSLQVALSGLPPDMVAQIRVDGEELKGATASMPRKLNPGPHEVTAMVDGQLVARQRVTLLAGEDRVVAVPIDPDRLPDEGTGSSMSPLAWVGFGVAAAGLVIGTITGIVALTSADEAKSHCQADDTCTADAQDAIDRTTVAANVSTASFIIGGVGLGVGLFALFALDADSTDSHSSAPAAVRVEAGPGWIGLAGTF